MLLSEMRVRNYRTIGAEQTLRLPSGTTLVGPNNSGKTNLLKAVGLFFTGYDNSEGYRRAVDLTFGAGSQQTSLVATFAADGHATDPEILNLLDELHAIIGTTRDSDSFNVNLYFTGANNTAVYRVFGNAKVSDQTDRPNYSRKQKQLVELLLGQFRVHYVPSAKSIDNLYTDLLLPFLAEAAYRAIEPQLDAVEVELKAVATSLNGELSKVGLGSITSEFHLDTSAPSRTLAGFHLMVSDPGNTPLHEKGQGIQSTALFASFAWITQREKQAGFTPIWLIEEPESYLHPELTKAVHEMLNNLSTESLVIATTHSLAFVPVDVQRVQGVDLDKGRTIISTFARHSDATLRIRQSLGVQFADYYNLGRTNIFVEGPSDEDLIRWASEILDPAHTRFPLVHESLIQDFGGVKQLEGFLRATFDPIRRERAVVSVFDGDEAGVKSRQALQGFFGQKNVDFKPNEHFVSVRNGYAIEGLFPDLDIETLHETVGGWFDTYSVDSAGELEPFRVKDSRKADFIRALKILNEGEDDETWAYRWVPFLEAIEAALEKQLATLGLTP